MELTQNTEILTGLVESIVFANEDNGYTVFSIEAGTEEDGVLVTCVGIVPGLCVGEQVELSGLFVVNPQYGRQFQVNAFNKRLPESAAGIERYLGSGAIKGIGERLARKIVETFGDETLAVIENQPEKLAQIRGINIEKAKRIQAVFSEQAELRNTIIFFGRYGISATMAAKAYKRYGGRAIDIAKTNPYQLSDEIIGFGFRSADALARAVGVDLYSPFRLQAGVRHVLGEAAANGHVYLPREILADETARLLEVEADDILSAVTEMHVERVIWQGKVNAYDAEQHDDYAVYLNAFFYAENFIAKRLIELSRTAPDISAQARAKLDNLDEAGGIKLSEGQKFAVLEALKHGVLVITGGPGTGKTTIINTIIKLLRDSGQSLVLAAPTGRAAKRMTEATGVEASTIHRLLELGYGDGDASRFVFGRDTENPIEASAIIIDEISMVDCMLMYNLLKAIEPGKRLILVGDADQLPSVGAGNVLKDIIDSGYIEVARLREVFRQSETSSIVTNAHKINAGEYPLFQNNSSDFFFIKREVCASCVDEVVTLATERVHKYLKCDRLMDVQVLTPMRKGDLGVINLNRVLQDAINPKSAKKNEKTYRLGVFREGDKVIQIKNNYNIGWRKIDSRGKLLGEGTGVFNGDDGIITRIDESAELLTVCYDGDRYVEYDFTMLEELELAYALTIHKAQGSEYKAVILPVHSGPQMLLSRNLLYTAVTRAKSMCVLVGTRQMVCRMIDNYRVINRYTSLSEKIRRFGES